MTRPFSWPKILSDGRARQALGRLFGLRRGLGSWRGGPSRSLITINSRLARRVPWPDPPNTIWTDGPGSMPG